MEFILTLTFSFFFLFQASIKNLVLEVEGVKHVGGEVCWVKRERGNRIEMGMVLDFTDDFGFPFWIYVHLPPSFASSSLLVFFFF